MPSKRYNKKPYKAPFSIAGFMKKGQQKVDVKRAALDAAKKAASIVINKAAKGYLKRTPYSKKHGRSRNWFYNIN